MWGGGKVGEASFFVSEVFSSILFYLDIHQIYQKDHLLTIFNSSRYEESIITETLIRIHIKIFLETTVEAELSNLEK